MQGKGTRRPGLGITVPYQEFQNMTLTCSGTTTALTGQEDIHLFRKGGSIPVQQNKSIIIVLYLTKILWPISTENNCHKSLRKKYGTNNLVNSRWCMFQAAESILGLTGERTSNVNLGLNLRFSERKWKKWRERGREAELSTTCSHREPNLMYTSLATSFRILKVEIWLAMHTSTYMDFPAF